MLGMYEDGINIIPSNLYYSFALAEWGLSICGPTLNLTRERVAPDDRVRRTDHHREQARYPLNMAKRVASSLVM
eukprot:1120820-Pleurochrysis_carterae.AAC.1